ncbi:hypothetical protein K443DRAFT_580986 [Laccaria amethystina LaAM-08-1]|jgi:hypothetical protein|uniref:Uncharacterized protein n=1 Tax=Laccaria amethystina LaAM-08-1 TaxID=1095629 RepID=A0A0C9XZ38_9AGAR|nr:hypothetical protein K443DRAFT_580986 [Laccaria amethystina LaAM-08-1]
MKGVYVDRSSVGAITDDVVVSIDGANALGRGWRDWPESSQSRYLVVFISLLNFIVWWCGGAVVILKYIERRMHSSYTEQYDQFHSLPLHNKFACIFSNSRLEYKVIYLRNKLESSYSRLS